MLLPTRSAQWAQATALLHALLPGTHSDIVTLYLMHFHQSHTCMHTTERCFTACVNYGSSWMCQIIRLGKQDFSILQFYSESKINTNLHFTSFWSKLIYRIIKTILCFLSVNNRYLDLVRTNTGYGKKRKGSDFFWIE